MDANHVNELYMIWFWNFIMVQRQYQKEKLRWKLDGHMGNDHFLDMGDLIASLSPCVAIHREDEESNSQTC